MNPKTDTLFAGRTLVIPFEDGQTRDITVRQIRLGEYQKLLPLVEDEIALVRAVCDLGAPASGTASSQPLSDPTPAGHELLFAAVQEVNEKGFFAFAARRMAAGQREIRRMLDAGIPAERLVEMLRTSISSMPSRATPPRAV